MELNVLEVFEITEDTEESVLNFADSISLAKHGKGNLLLLTKGACDNSIAVWLGDKDYIEELQQVGSFTISYINKERFRDHLMNYSLGVFEYY